MIADQFEDSGLQILSQKSLIHIDSNKIWTHDLFQEMDREIVRQESPENPNRRSRLWYHEDILRVLWENSGTNSVEGIKLDMLEPEEVVMGMKAIKQMKRLRLVMVHNIHISGCPEYLSNEIGWLDVHGNNLPATVEGNGPAQPGIHDSSPTKRAKNEQHHASRNCKINCRAALSDFKRIMATARKLAQFLHFGRQMGYSHNNGEADFDSDVMFEKYSVFKKFTKAELVCVTNNFSDDNKIGGGSADLVYHGILDDGWEVAIKWTNATTKGFQDRMFITEVKTLHHVNHKNLVRMLGFYAKCSECALVYEYMNNCSMFYHLHTIGSSTSMSWIAWLKVALDVARGIEYLHGFAGPQIVHLDVKSANIFLDENWTAKVSDFGLARFLPEDEVSDFSPDVLGTFGYVAPKYYLRNCLTTKSDVYSYGIVLLELLSGYKALHWEEDGSKHCIVDIIVPRIVRGEVDQALDPNMLIPGSFEMKAIIDMACLAAQCVQVEARSRPSMTDIVDRLRSALAQCSSIV
ncbi:hypothetical protein BT93_A0773 [Corymbia citriodora subsp. variegata]|nr:hypothetical protein BT93_A0773 [Corymbia citriodora subsp. variegata]